MTFVGSDSRFHAHLDRAVYNPARVHFQVDLSRIYLSSAGADVVDATVKRTLDLTVLDDAAVEEEFLMGAGVAAGEKLASKVVKSDRLVVYPDLNCCVWSDLVDGDDGKVPDGHDFSRLRNYLSRR